MAAEDQMALAGA